MEHQFIILAKKILSVLPDNAPEEFERLFNAGELTQDQEDTMPVTWSIVRYDLDSSEVVRIPASASRFKNLINKHLTEPLHSTQWALLHQDAVALRMSEKPDGREGRILLFAIEFITDLLHRLFPNHKFTRAEIRIVMQVLVGISLKHAAEQDFVSYETKKTQLRSVFQKTEIKHQRDLSMMLISHLTIDIAANWSRRASLKVGTPDDVFFEYADRYLGKYARASVIKESNQHFRILELGDLTGTPIIFIHHLGLFHFHEKDIKLIRDKGIRLICPLRSGALGPQDEYLTDDQNLEHALKGIDVALTLIAENNAPLLSLQSGCHYAVQYTDRKPDNVSKLLMLGASPVPTNDVGNLSVFMRGLQTLALKHLLTLKATITFLNKRVNDENQLKKVMLGVYKHGSADKLEIENLFADERQVAAMQCRLKNSAMSIVQDLRFRALTDWSRFQSIPARIPIYFIHGDADKLAPKESLSPLIALRCNTQLHSVENVGNLLLGQQTSKLFDLILQISQDDHA